jgi:predicted DNA-binding protein (UPF0251 family)
MRRKITRETWEQIKTVYAAGINLREIARKMDIPRRATETNHRKARKRRRNALLSNLVIRLEPLSHFNHLCGPPE